jgi:hypothetical protein
MRKFILAVALAPLLITTYFGASAQQQAQAPTQAASAPRPPAPGYGPPRGRGPHFGREDTPGWSMMTRAERDEHRQKMRRAQTKEECNLAMDEHRQKMAERAKTLGRAQPTQPRRDACAGRFP